MIRRCLDTSAWIEIFHRGANCDLFLEALGDPRVFPKIKA